MSTTIHIPTKPDSAVGAFKIPGKNLTVLVPVTKDAYGDEKSLSQLVEDVVGKHSDDKTARTAGKQAAAQFNQDWPTLRRKLAAARVAARRPKALMTPVMDNTGTVRGYKVLFTYVEGESVRITEHYISREAAEATLSG